MTNLFSKKWRAQWGTNGKRILVFGFLLLSSLSLHAQEEPKKLDPARWEKDIQAFESKDKEQFPPLGGILFVGSSSIRMWDLSKFFPDLPVINRGFGGSHMEDSVYFAKRIVLPYRPKTIVLYAGDNDIQSGKSSEKVLSDFQAFVKLVHAELPQTRILYIAIKPSIQRWANIERIREANQTIQEWIEKDPAKPSLLQFIDIDSPMIGEDGKPRATLLLEDGLHLNDEGYKLWTSILLPALNGQPTLK